MHPETPTWADFSAAFELFRDPILCGVAAGGVLGLLSVFIVLRRMVFVTATLTQASGLGVALGFFAHIHLDWHIPPTLSALLTALAAAGLISLRAERVRLSRESVLAGVWLLCSAAAVLVGDRITQEAHDIGAILFGTAVLVRPEDLQLVLGVGGLVAVITILCREGFVFSGFDPDGARVQGLPVRLLELLLVGLITLEVGVTTRALGALPVFGFSVLPGVAALLAAPRLGWALPLAGLFGALAGGLGYLVAFFGMFPVGASQAAVAACFVVLMIPLRALRGG
ncbi:metal ABC transporter permease [Myxococcota bacterium]|nr:metal ABC transporter permease [Myxococcota bacterium]